MVWVIATSWLGPQGFAGGFELYMCLAAMFGTVVASLKAFPHLGRQAGPAGVMSDLLIIYLAVFVAAAIAGCLVMPGIGLIYGPIFMLAKMAETPALAWVVVFGTISALLLARTGRSE